MMHSIKIETIIKEKFNNMFPFELFIKFPRPQDINLTSYKTDNLSTVDIRLEAYKEDNCVYWVLDRGEIYLLDIICINGLSDIEIENTFIRVLNLKVFL